jgi:hypothetical protein
LNFSVIGHRGVHSLCLLFFLLKMSDRQRLKFLKMRWRKTRAALQPSREVQIYYSRHSERASKVVDDLFESMILDD